MEERILEPIVISEPAIEKQGTDRILIQLPGVVDRKRAKEIIGKTALLEFRIVEDREVVQNLLTKIDEYLTKVEISDSSFLASGITLCLTVAICGRCWGQIIVAMIFPPKAGRV